MHVDSTVLARIAKAVSARLEERKVKLSLPALSELAKGARKPRPFTNAFTKEIAVIAEIKFKSPSEGDLNTKLTAVEVARDYLQNGAAALSILTEQDFFNGSFENLKQVREAFPESFILMKDFIVDEYQIYEALLNGADCILLIVALLGGEKTKAFLKLARELHLSVLVEVHDEIEMAVAVGLGASLIGVNNRDLRTLKTSLETSKRLIRLAPAQSTMVCESGINTFAQILGFKDLGFRGFLIGTSLMRQGQPGVALRNLLGGD